MNSKLCFNPGQQRRLTKMRIRFCVLLGLTCLAVAQQSARAADAPAWMHALMSAPLPPHDEKTDAVLLYAEDILNVQGNGKIKSISRRAYKILRPDGREYGTVHASFDGETRITGMRGWCIPAQGNDYEVKDKESVETALLGVENSELVSDL